MVQIESPSLTVYLSTSLLPIVNRLYASTQLTISSCLALTDVISTVSSNSMPSISARLLLGIKLFFIRSNTFSAVFLSFKATIFSPLITIAAAKIRNFISAFNIEYNVSLLIKFSSSLNSVGIILTIFSQIISPWTPSDKSAFALDKTSSAVVLSWT